MRCLTVILSFYLFNAALYSQETKPFQILNWSTQIPAEWEVQENENGQLFIVGLDTIFIDTLSYIPTLCPVLQQKYLVVNNDSISIFKNEEVELYNNKLKAANPDCFLSTRKNIILDNEEFLLITPIDEKALMALYYSSKNEFKFLHFKGRGLSLKTQEELLGVFYGLRK